MSVFVTLCARTFVRDIVPDETNVAELLSSFLCLEDAHLLGAEWKKGANQSSVFVLCNGRKVSKHSVLEVGKNYHVVPKVLGGKGGFGSMLRAIGAQIEKTTSREACRDLSGRRMRDINNEKKLKDWLAKEADREREREERHQERLARRSRPSQHKFEDAQYHEQRVKVQDDLEDALQKGLNRVKRKDLPESCGAGPSKKSKTISSKEFLGVDIDSDDLQSDSDNEAYPGSSGESCNAEIISKPCTTSSSLGNTSPPSGGTESPCTVKEEPVNRLVDNPNIGEIKTEPATEIKAEVIDSNEPIDLQDYTSQSELCDLGLDRLKNALTVRGLKCGGTLEERAERLFSIKGLSPDQINPSLFAKSKGKGKKSKSG